MSSKSKCKLIQNLDEKSDQARPANNLDLIKSDYDAFSDCGNTSILCLTNNSNDEESFINEIINYSSSSTTVSYICVMQSRLITNKHHLVHRFLTLLWKLLLSLPIFLFCNKVHDSLFWQVSWSSDQPIFFVFEDFEIK